MALTKCGELNMIVYGGQVKGYITTFGDFLEAHMVATTTDRPKPPKSTARKEIPINAEYEVKAKAMLRDAMVANGLNYDALAKRLNTIGVEITGRGLENKISRGGFSAAFLLQCMDAIGDGRANLV